MQRVGRLIEARLRCVEMLGQLGGAFEGLLRQHHARLCALERGLTCRDRFGARAGMDVGELRLGRTRYQIDSAETARNSTPTKIDGRRLDEGAFFVSLPDVSAGSSTALGAS